MTNSFPTIGKNTIGRDFNFYQKVTVSTSSFGGGSINGQQPDIIITFAPKTVMMVNEATLGTNVVEYSFNGNTVHGELDPTLPTRGLFFDNRQISTIWFRVKSGSSGPITVRVDAY